MIGCNRIEQNTLESGAVVGSWDLHPEGPSSQYVRTLVQNHSRCGFWNKNLKHWEVGPYGTGSFVLDSGLCKLSVGLPRASAKFVTLSQGIYRHRT